MLSEAARLLEQASDDPEVKVIVLEVPAVPFQPVSI